MADNYLKTPLGQSLNDWAYQKILNAVNSQGRALPCSVVAVEGSIVTVRFEVNAAPATLPRVKIPVAGAEYIRYPIQVGCLGVAFPASVRIGNVSGLSPGVPTMATPGNLAALVFFPCGNVGWPATDDANSLVIYGPDGVIIRTMDGSKKVVVSATGTKVTGDLENTGVMKPGNGAPGTNVVTAGGHTLTFTNGILTGFT